MLESEFELVKLSPMRRMIAARMSAAKQTIPHFRISSSVEVDRLLDFNRMYNASDALRITINDLVIHATALALVKVPDVNLQWSEDGLRRFAHADIAVVTSIPGGLTTPILRRADQKSLETISREVKTLGVRAVTGDLKLDEIIGGSFGISNLGMFGVDQFDAIISPPQCAMLAVGRTVPRVLPAPDGRLRTATVMQLTLSVDHRAIDGATAASFLAALRHNLETPETLAQAGPAG